MNTGNTSKITLIIFFALNAINTQLFTSENKRTLFQKFNITAIATAITITSLVATPTLAENIKNNHNVLWSLSAEAFRRIEMCNNFGCLTSVKSDANKILRECFNQDPIRAYSIHEEVSKSFSTQILEESTRLRKELYFTEKNFDELSFEQFLDKQK